MSFTTIFGTLSFPAAVLAYLLTYWLDAVQVATDHQQGAKRRHLKTGSAVEPRVHRPGARDHLRQRDQVRYCSCLKASSHRLSCPCRVRELDSRDNSRLSPTENLKSEHVQSNCPTHTGTRNVNAYRPHDAPRWVIEPSR